jgi:uncharacterized membrane protein YeaQ/YmgE (transglycosylase-associated protein family)
MTTADARPGTTAGRSGALLWTLRIVGALLLAAMGWIHLDLWLDGYKSIDVIGPAFLLNTIGGFGLAVLLLVTPRRFLPWVAALGALMCAGTLGALLLSTTVGLFGFVETTAADLWWESFIVEICGAVVLAVLAALAARRREV